MANPRQRRKLRSGSHKPVRQSRRTNKLLKKQPPIRGPKVLHEAWDKQKTVRQNYEALGLVASLNPMASGGVERSLAAGSTGEQSMQIDATPQASTSTTTGPSLLRKGFGRIIRDEDGNVIDVELASDEEEESAPVERLVEDIPDPSGQEGLSGWVAMGFSTASSGNESHPPDTHVVQSLEEISTRAGPTPRFASTGERAELQRLVAKYQQDVNAMALDRKLNPNQRTAGQLSRAIKKAGGFAELLKGC